MKRTHFLNYLWVSWMETRGWSGQAGTLEEGQPQPVAGPDVLQRPQVPWTPAVCATLRILLFLVVFSSL